MSGVAALIFGGSQEPLAAEVEPRVTELLLAASLAEVRASAAGAEAELLWVLAADVRPTPEALERLLEAGRRPAVSLPVDSEGAAVERLIGRFAEDDVEAILEAARARQVPLRHTQVLSLLIERQALLDEDPPDPGRVGPYAGTEWTARLFAKRRGYLVPASRVETARNAPVSVLSAAHMARAGVWGRGETISELGRAMGGRAE